jgi:ABC-type nitrate/sulfonate/bicarbonate transport system permease component
MATVDEETTWLDLELPNSQWVIVSTATIIGLGVWVVIAAIFPNNLMPYPTEAAATTIDLVRSGQAWPDLRATLFRTFWGFIGATILGIAIGIVMGLNNYGQQFLTPYVFIGLSIPGIAWAAITTLVFGLGTIAPVIATVVTAAPFISLNIWKGVENIDVDLLEMSNAFDVSKPRLLMRTILPNIAPALFTAFRFGVAISWKVETNAEIFAANNGVGAETLSAFSRFQYEEAWGWALLFVGVILIIEFGVIKPLERRVFDYRQDIDYSTLD